MKNILVYIKAVILTAIIFTACKKNDGPTPIELIRVPQVQVTKVEGSDQVIDVLNLEGFEGKFTIGTYYANDIKPEKMDVVIIKNGDNTNVKVFKSAVTSFPSEYTVTIADLEGLFGEPVELNDRFDVGGDVYLNGQKFEAFPLKGTANGGGVASQPGATPFTRYAAICAYDPAIYQGDFEVVLDEWGDYAEGDIVPLTYVDDTHVSFMYADDDAKPIIIEIKPDNSTFVAKQVYGAGYGAGYGVISCETVPSFDNYVAPCDKIISVRLKHTVSAGSFGENTITLKKAE